MKNLSTFTTHQKICVFSIVSMWQSQSLECKQTNFSHYSHEYVGKAKRTLSQTFNFIYFILKRKGVSLVKYYVCIYYVIWVSTNIYLFLTSIFLFKPSRKIIKMKFLQYTQTHTHICSFLCLIREKDILHKSVKMRREQEASELLALELIETNWLTSWERPRICKKN